MNLVFRTVWNRTLGRLVVTSEAARSQGKSTLSKKVVGAIAGGAAALALLPAAFAAPELLDQPYTEPVVTDSNGDPIINTGLTPNRPYKARDSEIYGKDASIGGDHLTGTPSDGYAATAIGANARADTLGTAVGSGSGTDPYGQTRAGYLGTAYGAGSVSGLQATATGTYSKAENTNSIAMGYRAQAKGDYSIVVGPRNVVTGTKSGAFGSSRKYSNDEIIVSGNHSYSFGNNNIIKANNAFVLGNNVGIPTDPVDVDGSVTLGNNSTAEANDVTPAAVSGAAVPPGGAVSVGASGNERQIKHVAGGTADTDVVNVAQLKASVSSAQTHYYSVNDGGNQGGNYNNDGAMGTNSLAAGVNAFVGTKAYSSIAVGDDASVDGARSYNSIAIGSGATVAPRSSPLNPYANSAIAIGKNANASRELSVVMGAGANDVGMQATVIGGWAGLGAAYSGQTGPNGGATLIGTQAGRGATLGYVDTFVGFKAGYKSKHGDPTGAQIEGNNTGVGDNALRNTTGSHNVALGGYGPGSHSTGSNNVSIGGFRSGDKVAGSSNIAMGSEAGRNIEGDSNIAIGTATGDGYPVTNTGAGQNVTGSNNIALGASAGQNIEASETVSIGYLAEASKDDAIAMGNGAIASGEQSISIGTGNVVSGANSGAFGDPSTVTGSGSYAFGNDNYVDSDNTFVLGSNVGTTTEPVDIDGSVTLGNNSTAEANDVNPAVNSGAVAPVGGAVSVGSENKERQIKHVAGGTADTDAVNVEQLSAAQTHYYSVNDNGVQGGNYNNDGATGENSMAAGVDAEAKSKGGIAMGHGATATGPGGVVDSAANNIAIGSKAEASATQAIALGHRAKSSHFSSVAIGTDSVADKKGASALGHEASATGDQSIAIGRLAAASKTDTIALGYKSKATVKNAVAIGDEAEANAQDAWALGRKAKAEGNFSMAMGQGSLASELHGIAIGATAKSYAEKGIAIGTVATVGTKGEKAIAIGDSSIASGKEGLAIGPGASVALSAPGGVAVGSGARVIAQEQTSVGELSGAFSTGSQSNTLIGYSAGHTMGGKENTATGTKAGASSKGDQNTFMGYLSGNKIDGSRNVAIGNSSGNAASGDHNVFIGNNAGKGSTTSNKNIAIGLNAGANLAGVESSIAIGDGTIAHSNSIAIGTGNKVTGKNSGAIGDPSSVSGAGSYAMGNNNTIDANNAFVFGNNVTIASGLDGAVGIGNNSAVAASTVNSFIPTGATSVVGTTKGSNVVSVGSEGNERRLTNVAAGGADTDAVNVSQLKELNSTVVANKTHYYSVNDGGTPQGNYNNDGASGSNALAAGVDAKASGSNSIAVGNYALASDRDAIAIGGKTGNSGEKAYGARALAKHATAVGGSAQALAERSTAFGRLARAHGEKSTAVGDDTAAYANQSTVLGHEAVAGEKNKPNVAIGSMALGHQAEVNKAGSVALGAGSKAFDGQHGNTANDFRIAGSTQGIAGITDGSAATVSVGTEGAERQIQNVAPGVVDANSTDAINGSQLFATNKVIANIDFPIRSSNAQPYTTSVTGTDALAVGSNAIANGDRSTTVGENAQAIGIQASAFGAGAEATARSSLASGFEAKAKGGESVALGVKSNAEGLGATAVGPTANARGEDSVALGRRSKADGAGAMALGGFSKATGENATAAGNNALATGVKATAFGSEANAAMDGATAIGNEAFAKGIDATAVGNKAQAGRNSIALGMNANALNSGTVALGTQSFAGQGATVVGTNAKAGGKDSTALGRFSEANDADSVALGSFSETAAAVGTASITLLGKTYNFAGAVPKGTVSVGTVGNERTITNVAAGRISAISTDAINGSQLFATNTALGDLNDTVVANKTHYYSVNSSATGAGSNYDNDGATGADSLAAGVRATATANRAIAMGTDASATGSESTALGSAAQAFSGSATAVGFGARADQYGATAMGTNSRAQGDYSTAVGTESEATGERSVAMGYKAEASEVNSVAIGNESQATKDSSIALGNKAQATGSQSIAQGTHAKATGNFSVAQGYFAEATGDRAIAYGRDAKSTYANAVALGTGSVADGSTLSTAAYQPLDMNGDPVAVAAPTASSEVSVGVAGNERRITNVAAGATDTDAVNVSQLTALAGVVTDGQTHFYSVNSTDSTAGNYNNDGATGANALAAGVNARAEGEDATAVGSASYAKQKWSTAIGFDSKADGRSAVALGHQANANHNNSAAVGYGASAGYASTAIGERANAVKKGSTAIGSQSEATRVYSTALGRGAKALHDDSVALGSYSETATAVGTTDITLLGKTYTFAGINPESTVSVGTAGKERTITNVAAGRISAASTDAINGSQLNATNLALTEVNTTANKGWDLSAQGEAAENVVPGGEVNLRNEDGNLTVTQATKNGREEVTFDLADDVTIGNNLTVTNDTQLGDHFTVNKDGETIYDVTIDNSTGDKSLVNKEYVDQTGTDLTEKGLDFAGNDSSVIHKNLGQQLNIVGGMTDMTPAAASAQNLRTVKNIDGDLEIQMSETPKFGKVTINTDGGDTINGLTNTTWDPENQPIVSGQAATEDQLQIASTALTNKGLNFAGNTGPGFNTPLGETVNIVGRMQSTDSGAASGRNIRTVAKDNGELVIQMSRDLIDLDSIKIDGGGPVIDSDGIDMGDNKITNLAPGAVNETSTDAVNGSQLWQVRDTANAGWNLTTNGEASSLSNVAPKDTVDFSGDGNVLVSNKGNDVTVELADIITLGDDDENKVTVNGVEGKISVGEKVTLDKTGLIIADGGPSVTINGIFAGNQQITGVASGLGGQPLDKIRGDDLMNAVNVGDLQQVAGDIGNDVAAAKTVVTEGKNIKVTESTGDNGESVYEVATSDEVVFDKVDVGTVTIDKGNVDDDGNTIITGVGKGEVSADSTDAVNGSQLHQVKNEIGDINTSLDGGLDFAADEGDPVKRKLGDTVGITGDDNITTRTSSDGVQVTLNRDLNVDSVTTGRTTVSDKGVTIEGGPSMTVDGIDGGGKRITNVAPGVDATDAATMGQLKDLNQSFYNEIGGMHRRISDLEDNAFAGVASAIAAASVPQTVQSGKSMFAVGAGTYKGESAVSVGVSRLSDNGRMAVKLNVTGDSQGNFGAGIGAGWHW